MQMGCTEKGRMRQIERKVIKMLITLKSAFQMDPNAARPINYIAYEVDSKTK